MITIGVLQEVAVFKGTILSVSGIFFRSDGFLVLRF